MRGAPGPSNGTRSAKFADTAVTLNRSPNTPETSTREFGNSSHDLPKSTLPPAGSYFTATRPFTGGPPFTASTTNCALALTRLSEPSTLTGPFTTASYGKAAHPSARVNCANRKRPTLPCSFTRSKSSTSALPWKSPPSRPAFRLSSFRLPALAVKSDLTRTFRNLSSTSDAASILPAAS